VTIHVSLPKPSGSRPSAAPSLHLQAKATPATAAPKPAVPKPARIWAGYAPAAQTSVAPRFAALRKRLRAIIATYPQYQLGVAVIDMSDGVLHNYGVQGKFVAASTGKILAAVAYYHYAERGLLSLTAPMGRNTAAFQLQQSNNDSWALILNAIGNQRIHDYGAALRLPYDRPPNQLSPAETATLLISPLKHRSLGRRPPLGWCGPFGLPVRRPRSSQPHRRQSHAFGRRLVLAD
jgi:hypothetical protein